MLTFQNFADISTSTEFSCGSRACILTDLFCNNNIYTLEFFTEVSREDPYLFFIRFLFNPDLF